MRRNKTRKQGDSKGLDAHISAILSISGTDSTSDSHTTNQACIPIALDSIYDELQFSEESDSGREKTKAKCAEATTVDEDLKNISVK